METVNCSLPHRIRSKKNMYQSKPPYDLGLILIAKPYLTLLLPFLATPTGAAVPSSLLSGA